MKASQQGVQSVEVAGRLLHALVEEGHAMMLKDLAKAARMPPAKAHRYLVSLGRLGLVDQDATSGRYDLANFSLQLGLARQGRIDAISAATSILEELRDTTGESVLLAVWGDQGATVVRVLESRRLGFVLTRVGAVMPLTWSATGLAFTAFLPQSVTQRLVTAELELNRGTAGIQAPKTKKDLEALVAPIREHGLARIQGTVTPGTNALGAPVFDHESAVVAVITILGSERNVEISWDGKTARAILDAARNISKRLGYVTPKK